MLNHFHRLPIIGVSLVLLLLNAANASADTVRVLVDRALIWSRPSGVSVVLTQVSRNQELTLLRQVNDWYEVVLPGARGPVSAPTGFIRVSQAVVWILEPNGPMAASLQLQTPATRRSRMPGFFHLDVGYRLGGDELVRTSPAFADIYAEEGSISANYGNGSGPQVDLMFGSYLTPKFALAGGFSFFQTLEDARLEAQVPHPFYLNQFRTASADSSEVTANELGFHISALFTVWETPVQRFSIFGGPSFFRVSQQVPIDLSIDEAYPYDEVAIDGVTTDSAHDSAFGFHVGGDYTRFFGRHVGVGFAARYSRASVDANDPADSTPGSEATTTGTAGSAVISGGVRFRF